jgi:hypothetical protein
LPDRLALDVVDTVAPIGPFDDLDARRVREAGVRLERLEALIVDLDSGRQEMPTATKVPERVALHGSLPVAQRPALLTFERPE